MYLEAVVLIPQFALLYKREKYDTWVLFLVIFMGLEKVIHNAHYTQNLGHAMKKDPYGRQTPKPPNPQTPKPPNPQTS